MADRRTLAKGEKAKSRQKEVKGKLEDESDNLPDKPESRADKFARHLFTCKTVREAALKAGYTRSSANSSVYTLLKSPSFQDKLRTYAANNDLLDIPKIQRIESKILELLVENPEKYPKFRQIFTEKKRIAGLLQSGETAPRAQTVNIGEIKVLVDSISRRASLKQGGHN